MTYSVSNSVLESISKKILYSLQIPGFLLAIVSVFVLSQFIAPPSNEYNELLFLTELVLAFIASVRLIALNKPVEFQNQLIFLTVIISIAYLIDITTIIEELTRAWNIIALEVGFILGIELYYFLLRFGPLDKQVLIAKEINVKKDQSNIKIVVEGGLIWKTITGFQKFTIKQIPTNATRILQKMLVNYSGMTVETVNGLEIIFSVKKSGLFFLQAIIKSEIVKQIE